MNLKDYNFMLDNYKLYLLQEVFLNAKLYVARGNQKTNRFYHEHDRKMRPIKEEFYKELKKKDIK